MNKNNYLSTIWLTEKKHYIGIHRITNTKNNQNKTRMKKRVMVGIRSESPSNTRAKKSRMNDDTLPITTNTLTTNTMPPNIIKTNDGKHPCINQLISKIEIVVESLLSNHEPAWRTTGPDLTLFSQHELEENFKPIVDELRSIDAESMLSLNRISKEDGGACVGEDR